VVQVHVVVVDLLVDQGTVNITHQFKGSYFGEQYWH
jgi:hypothetical protein